MVNSEAGLEGARFAEADNRRSIFVFVGPEGSGKSTHAQSLAEKLGIPRFSMGDEFRRLAQDEPDTELGRRSQELFDKHLYSDRDLYTRVFEGALKRGGFENGFVGDGAFRALWEPEVFKELVERYIGVVDVKVIFLRTAVWQSMERLAERNRGDDDIKRREQFYKNLGPRMALVEKGAAQFIIIQTTNKTIEEVDLETLEKLGLNDKASY